MASDKENIKTNSQAFPEHALASKKWELPSEQNARRPLKPLNYLNLVPSTSSNEICHPKNNVAERRKNEFACASNKDNKSNEDEDVIYETPGLETSGVLLKDYRLLYKNKFINRPVDLKKPVQDTANITVADTQHVRCSKNEFSLQERLKSSDANKEMYTNTLKHDYLEYIFPHLLSVEKRPLGFSRLLERTRTCLLNWLIKVNGVSGNPAVIQTTCWYLDSFLSMEDVAVSNMQQVAAASFWISQKHHGSYYSARRLAKYSNDAFSSQSLRAAERYILRRLNFPSQPVVAEDYIPYIAWWCDSENCGVIEVSATFICLAGMICDTTLSNEYPSVLAMASIKTALELLNDSRSLCRFLSSPMYKAAKVKIRSLTILAQLREFSERMSSNFEYNTLFQYYNLPPYHIAQRLVTNIRHLDAAR